MSEGLVRAARHPSDGRTPAGAVGRAPKAEARYANPRIKIAGFGGQGVLLLGVGLADCGMRAGYQVSWLPSYGPEMRGGTANCHVRISDTPIGSPVVEESDVLIAMNKPVAREVRARPAPDGLLLYDSSLIDDRADPHRRRGVAVPATQMADELGSTKVGQHGHARRLRGAIGRAGSRAVVEAPAEFHQGEADDPAERAGDRAGGGVRELDRTRAPSVQRTAFARLAGERGARYYGPWA